MKDLNANDVEAAMRIEGSARLMGLKWWADTMAKIAKRVSKARRFGFRQAVRSFRSHPASEGPCIGQPDDR